MMPTIDFDPLDASIMENPYSYYQELREKAPVFYDDRRDQWLVSRYRDVEAVLLQSKQYHSEVDPMFDPGGFNGGTAAEHARVRRIAGRFFSRQRIDALEPFIATTSSRLLNAAERGGTFDFVDDFTGWLPIAVLSHLIGLEEEHWPSVRQWSRIISAHGVSALQTGIDGIGAEFNTFFGDQLVKNFRTPGDNLISAFLWASDVKDRLQPWEILCILRIFQVAAVETTANLLGNICLLLLKDPSVLALMQARKDRIPALVEESLRYDTPFQYLKRITTEDVQIGEFQIAAGNCVVLMLGAANRDPDIFEHPETFMLNRRLKQHLAFGAGVRTCLGSQLARREAAIAMEVMLERVSRWHPAENIRDVSQVKGSAGILRGPQRILLTCEAASTEAV